MYCDTLMKSKIMCAGNKSFFGNCCNFIYIREFVDICMLLPKEATNNVYVRIYGMCHNLNGCTPYFSFLSPVCWGMYI